MGAPNEQAAELAMSSPPFTVKAVFEYASGHDDDLSFPIGQVLTVTAEEDAEWYYGEYTDGSGAKQEGIFPKNFVERYEPPAPPRPSRPARPKKEAEPAPPPAPAPVESPVVESNSQPEPELEEQATAEEPAHPQPAPTQSSQQAASLPPATQPAAPPPPAASKPPPPAVAEKPSGSSFKDRIAAFNKPAAAPVTPFKPSGSSSSFIKKPFVPAPPSKDSYVPPPREPAPKIYKREEDPQVQEQIAREPPVSESRPPPPLPTEAPAEGEEDQPKPTRLKDRIALLQKQQLEQAQRHAEAAQKKEKSRHPKKQAEGPAVPATPGEELEEPEEPGTTEALESARDPSVDTLRGSAHAPQVPTPFSPPEEMVSDTNDADYSAAADSEDAGETSTSKDEDEERSHPSIQRQPSSRSVEQQGDEADVEEETGEEEEEDMDPETRRRMELRNRMAKMSGGMGMMGLFGPPGGMPTAGARKPKTPGESEKRLGESEVTSPTNAPPVPMVPMPGMNIGSKPPRPSADVEKEEEEPLATPVSEQHPAYEVADVEDTVREGALPRRSTDRAPPVPPSRAPPPPKPADTGDESDDELSVHTGNLSLSAAPPAVPAPAAPDHVDSRRSSAYDTPSTIGSTPTTEKDKRLSRPPPPIPQNPPMPPSQGRAPPPPPRDQLRRRSTADSRSSAISAPRQAGEEAEGEVTEYDGDYDTDIASSAKFKDALKSHERDSSFDEGTITDDHSLHSPIISQETRTAPPPPPSAPRAVPPPPPSQPPRNARASIDTPRGPPPPPPPKESSGGDDEEEYDPFNYSTPQHGLPTPPPLPQGRRPEAPPPPIPQAQAADEEDDLYEASPVQSPQSYSTTQHEKRPSLAPPPPPSQAPAIPSPSASRSQRQSMDFMRAQPNVRRSMDVSRPSVDQGCIAQDIDLAENTLWWTQPNTPPPVFQNRKDLLYEVEESSSTKRGGKTMVSKDVYVLFLDYSQTVVTVQFDAKNPADASLEQRHESPPLQPRQDQLEEAHVQLGTRISEAINSIQNTTVGDGTPFGLIQHLLSPLSDALLPVGTRAYGALVYSNLANASVSQNDEIRAGDIVSFRNARFQGHRGTMHQKYSAEVGKPDHVGVVVDWDGTKKKIRAWEQGRESKKVKIESFKLGDLRSGECKVWRVMSRNWVGWETGK
ncbi:hypothetical protein N7474_010890 [Penicillium riverlandense]|uniref:uncharacterized protein n=1 Tax=Penicillium riverlandense TaxID=1903569 RepID=UPI00254673A7|nr:uncharacterized protein N7474_010890 [Penicillium riverlandense]KAJ5805003.1 hypothetical protein N7474_010890 [Penicillium riverlandense]